MSLLNVVPDTVTAAAGNLQDIGAAVKNANAAAAAQTTAIAAPAADEVSAGITALFGTHAQEFQALSAQATSFHEQFAMLLGGGAAQYLSAEAANAQQMLVNAVNTPAQGLLGHPLIGAAASTQPNFLVPNLGGPGYAEWVKAQGDLANEQIQQFDTALSSLNNNYNPFKLTTTTTGDTTTTAVGFDGQVIANQGFSQLFGLVGKDVGFAFGGPVGAFAGGRAFSYIGGQLAPQTGFGDALQSYFDGQNSLLSFTTTTGPGGTSSYSVGVGGLTIGANNPIPQNVGSILTDNQISELLTNVNSSGNILAVDINNVLDTATTGVTSTLSDPQSLLTPITNLPTELQTQLFDSTTQSSNFGFGPSFTWTSEQFSPYGDDGIQLSATGLFSFNAGPFGAPLGFVQGFSASDPNGGTASISTTVFGFNETEIVTEAPWGSAPQFFVSGHLPGF